MISVNNCNIFSPSGKILLRGFTLSVNKGDIIAICGPNGCGKTTLLRLMSGIDIGDFSLSMKLSDISYLPTRPLDFLLPWKSVADNIQIFSPELNAYQCISKIKIFFSQIGYRVDCDELCKKKTYQLSSGQQALIAIFCSTLKKPVVLISDEIFSTISKDLLHEVASFLKERIDTIVFSSHDNSFILSMGADVIDLSEYIVE